MAGSRKVRYTVDVHDVHSELDRLQHEPNERAILEFESILTGLFQETQAVVHVITGSLRSSGKAVSTLEDNAWKGEIRYGGDSRGAINDPVKYALFEWRRRGMHDFMRPTEDADSIWFHAMLDALRGQS